MDNKIDLQCDKLFKKLIIVAMAIIASPWAFSQNDSMRLHISQGSFYYKKLGKWEKAYSNLVLLDTTWIKLEKIPGYCLVSAKDKCAEIKKSGYFQIKTLAFSKCQPSLLEIFKKIPTEVNPPNLVYPSSDIQASARKLRFPSEGEIISPYMVTFSGLRKNDRGAAEISFMVKAKPELGINDVYNKGWVTREVHVSKPLITKKELESSFNSNLSKENLYWRSYQDEHPLSFTFASPQHVDSLNRILSLLEGYSSLFEYNKYMLVKAAIYYDFKMYTEANKIYSVLAVKSPSSKIINHSYSSFIYEIKIRNKQ